MLSQLGLPRKAFAVSAPAPPAPEAPSAARRAWEHDGGTAAPAAAAAVTAEVGAEAEARALRSWLLRVLSAHYPGLAGHNAARAVLSAHAAWCIINATHAARLMPPLAQLAALLAALLSDVGHPGGGLTSAAILCSPGHPLALRHAGHPRHPLEAHHCEVAATLLAAAAGARVVAPAEALAGAVRGGGGEGDQWLAGARADMGNRGVGGAGGDGGGGDGGADGGCGSGSGGLGTQRGAWEEGVEATPLAGLSALQQTSLRRLASDVDAALRPRSRRQPASGAAALPPSSAGADGGRERSSSGPEEDAGDAAKLAAGLLAAADREYLSKVLQLVRRGYDLYTTTYVPSLRRTSACLVFHHGLSDHSERHSAVLSHLCTSLGMAVYTYDAHGHGRSGPDGPMGRALIRSFNHMVDDLVDFTREFVIPAEEKAAAEADAADGAGAEDVDVDVEEEAEAGSSGSGSSSSSAGAGATRRRRPAPRIFLLGYSMGGLACNLAVATTSPSSSSATAAAATASAPAAAASGSASASPDASSDEASGSDAGPGSTDAGAPAPASDGLYAGLMLTSSLTDPVYGSSPLMRAVKLAYVSVLARLVPAMPLFKRNPVESGIRCPQAVAEMAADMLWYRGKFKVITIASLLWGCQRLRWCCHRIRLPMYVQHATVDVACSLASMRAFLTRVRSRDVTLHVVEGAYHDLHHDPETPVLLGRMVEWLRARV
ncbi:hypothetical protein GPECTOR_28g824 [Gonium pectorale]|uniref:Serine aminopeptidase S33 domain-containing protein n=1 Tax=Gonium pectorale TaxID=33097 RepID=A0A150GEY7_GONPE|nr:hypothetical protein GPECTOR_28g824 [Gonium pectorale]|eukprot:KXZ48417.1 hypothetical protein GPECTOR_28g824 [Gonium pectorale]